MPEKGVRLVQVFHENDPKDAVPFDQVIAKSGDKVPTIMIPDGLIRHETQTIAR